MYELVNSFPAVNVELAEYKRLLGYPADYQLDGRSQELIHWAANWYRQNGRPWVYARQVEDSSFDESRMKLEGQEFYGRELLRNLNDADADGIIVAAVSAGPELEAAAQQAWRDERPDEYFFLEMYGSAVVEHLVTMAGAQFCAWAEGMNRGVLPHYSPGYGDWDIAQQSRLSQVIGCGTNRAIPGPLEVLDSGMLRPKKSLLAVFGLTSAIEHARSLSGLLPCERCSFRSCQYRRQPYQQTADIMSLELSAAKSLIDSITDLSEQSKNVAPVSYRINRKALDRWANERLVITPSEDGTIDVIFKHEGSTCSNMGRPLVFDYHVRLGSRGDGYRILQQECSPATNHVGYQSMCGYLSDPAQMMLAIENEKPLLGKTLNEVLTWERPSTAAHCYCESVSRQHMWGQVLETIHYALHRD
jgi:hypothetical protein